jgi:hypothetical protein
MPIHSSLPFSKEVYEYLRASESLVAIALTRPQSFSDEELQIGARRHIARNDLCLPTKQSVREFRQPDIVTVEYDAC